MILGQALATTVLGGTLKPSLDLNFAQAGSLDGRITFTRASTATYVNSSGLIATASSGAARFGYDPSSLAALGYLSEEARTNLVIQSDTTSNAVWAVANAAKTSTNNSDPAGTSTAALLTANGISNSHSFSNTSGISVVSGTSYAFSLFAKAGTTDLIQLTYGTGGFATNVYANFQLAGVGTASGGAGVSSAAIQAFPNGWYRISMVATANASTASGLGGCWITSLSDLRAPTNSAATTFLIWGGQLEATTTNYPGPTSYIPTTSATVTRAADVASMTGSNFSSWYNQSQGTFVVQATPPGDYNQLGVILDAEQDGANWSAVLLKSDSASTAAGKRWSAYTDTGGVFVSQIAQGSNGAASTSKLAYAYATNDFALAADGVLVGTDASGALPTPIKLDIGAFRGTGSWFNGHIGSIKYYPKKLPNTKLQSLTV